MPDRALHHTNAIPAPSAHRRTNVIENALFCVSGVGDVGNNVHERARRGKHRPTTKTRHGRTRGRTVPDTDFSLEGFTSDLGAVRQDRRALLLRVWIGDYHL